MDSTAARETIAREIRHSRAMTEVYRCRAPGTILPKPKLSLYRFAVEYIGADQAIDYFEFGVSQGYTMRIMSDVLVNPQCRLYGFDSFVGLPEKWQMHDVGAFSANGIVPDIRDERISFVKGWFQNSVPEFFAGFKKDESRPILVHIDADLYSSALFLLTFLWHSIGEYFVLFDDFIYDEVIAVHDFMKAYPVEIQFFAQTKGGGEPPNPDQVFGHIKRVPFVLQT